MNMREMQFATFYIYSFLLLFSCDMRQFYDSYFTIFILRCRLRFEFSVSFFPPIIPVDWCALFTAAGEISSLLSWEMPINIEQMCSSFHQCMHVLRQLARDDSMTTMRNSNSQAACKKRISMTRISERRFHIER